MGFMITSTYFLRCSQWRSMLPLPRAARLTSSSSEDTWNNSGAIESPVRDSQANGSAERTVRTWAAQVRTMRHHREHRLQHKIPIWSSLMMWLVAWAAEVICRYRISYENDTGHKGLQPIAIFGERIMSKSTTDKNHRRKMESEWDHGYFLGINPGTTEYLIACGDDVYSCATIRRLEKGKTFNPTVIK